jgi:hypothetical protein
MLQNHDILIRREFALSKAALVEFFTLHRYPSDEAISGPFVSKDIATQNARQLAKDDGCDVWIQSPNDSSLFESID